MATSFPKVSWEKARWADWGRLWALWEAITTPPCSASLRRGPSRPRRASRGFGCAEWSGQSTSSHPGVLLPPSHLDGCAGRPWRLHSALPCLSRKRQVLSFPRVRWRPLAATVRAVQRSRACPRRRARSGSAQGAARKPRISELEVPMVAMGEPCLLESREPAAGLAAVAPQHFAEWAEWHSSVVEAPVEPPPAARLARERHAQSHWRAPRLERPYPRRQVESVEREAVGEVRVAGSDAANRRIWGNRSLNR